jgi:hypothetical protein
MGEPGTEKFAEALGALADQKIILPLREFASLTKRAALGESAAARLAGVYQRLTQGDITGAVRTNPFPVAIKLASVGQRRWAAQHRGHLSLDADAVDYRCKLSSVRNYAPPYLDRRSVLEKSAADAEPAERLAREYALYKLAALHRIASFDDQFALTARIAIGQNLAL